MGKITMFIRKDCPYCMRALAIQKNLMAKERYRDIEVEVIDEREQAVLADRYDYYYVPSYFLGEEKLHEGAVDEVTIQTILERAIL